MQDIYRGQVYYADLGEKCASIQGGKRPVVVVSNNVGNKNSGVVIVAPITSKQKKPLPTHVEISLPKVYGTILCEQLTTIDKESLFTYVGALTRVYLDKLNVALTAALDLEGKYSADASDLVKEEIDAQIKKCQAIQLTYIEQVALLGKMIGFYDSEAFNTPIQKSEKGSVVKRTPVCKKKYLRRSPQEIKEFITRWESGERETLLAPFDFTSVVAAQIFYKRHKEDKF